MIVPAWCLPRLPVVFSIAGFIHQVISHKQVGALSAQASRGKAQQAKVKAKKEPKKEPMQVTTLATTMA